MIAVQEMGKGAKEASRELARASTSQKNVVLKEIAETLASSQEILLKANREDCCEAKASGLSPALLDRLSLEGRIEGIVSDVHQVISLPDPVGAVLETRTLPNGLRVTKQRTPIGVLGVIYEARPNVTIDIASIALKTGNAVILRGGKETLRTNRVLVTLIQEALLNAGFSKEAVQLIDSPDRAYVKELLSLYQFVDLIIPRGGASLHEFCRKESHIPVITGGVGICHLFVDQSADLLKALSVIQNAKTQRPTVCNALDTLLVHEAVASQFIPQVFEKLEEVSFRLDPQSMHLSSSISRKERFQPADEEDWDMEWLSLVLGIKVVSGLEEAIAHIRQHSTGHSDGILTEETAHAKQFIQEVDSAAVYVNASTRFTDGAQFGLGAEVAVSTQKLHARGPMGLEELTSYKWIVEGNYQIRD